MSQSSVFSRLGRYARRPRHHARRWWKRRRADWDARRKFRLKEREWDVPRSARRPAWRRRGFLSRSVVLYDLPHNNPEHYITDVQRLRDTSAMVHPRIREVVDNKFTSHLLLRAIGAPTAVLDGVCVGDTVQHFPDSTTTGLGDYLDRLPVGGTRFFKGFTGGDGRKVYAVARSTSTTWVINGTAHTRDEAVAAIRDTQRPLIIEHALEQHPHQAALYPGAVNTLRVLTIPDLERLGEPHIVMAVQRIGSDASAPVDNWARGGLSARVDVETGELSRAARLPQGSELEWFDAHPDVGSAIRDAVVPHWGQVVELVNRSAGALAFMEYIGWDIVVTPEGPVLLELNSNTGLNVMQVHQPLLKDPKVRAFYERKRVLRP